MAKRGLWGLDVPDPAGSTVWVTKTDTRYHVEGCRFFKGGGREVSLDEVPTGLTACKPGAR